MATAKTIGPGEIQAAIARLAEAISGRHGSTASLLLLGIANGGVELARRLRADGVSIWYAADAAVSHPAPDGLKHAFIRAVCQGYDNVYWRRSKRPLGWLHASPLGGAVRLLRSIVKNGTTVPARVRSLGLDPMSAVGSFFFGTGYALVTYSSEIVAYFAPRLIRKHIQM